MYNFAGSMIGQSTHNIKSAKTW